MSKHWIPKDLKKGRCTPITKPSCTGHARALALTFKKHHGFHDDKKKEDGGITDTSSINVEHNELEVDPKTLQIVTDYKNKPEHPNKGMNPKGWVKAEVGNVIIPQQYRYAYLNGNENTKKQIIAEVIKNTSSKKMEGGGPVIDPNNIELPKEQLITKRTPIATPDYLDYLYSQEGIRKQYEQSVKDVEVIRNKIVEEGLNAVANKEDFEKAPWYANYEKNHPGEAKTCIGTQCDLANRAISKVNPKWKFPIQTSNSQFNQSVKEGNIPYEQIPLLETNKGDIIQEVLYKNGPPIHAVLSTCPMIYEETYPKYVDHGTEIKEQRLYRLPAISEGHKGPISLKNNKIFDDANAYRFVGDIPKLKKELETNQNTSFTGKKYFKEGGIVPDDPPKKRTILGHDIDKYGYLLPTTEIIGAKDKTTDYVLNELTHLSPDDQTPYKIWKMSGSPNIRFGSKIVYKPNVNNKYEIQRANYNGLTNTINLPDTVKDEDFIKRYKKFEDVYAEFPHSYQYNTDKSGTIKQVIKDWIKHPYFSQDQYDKYQYEQEGSLEYEAHKKLQPQFEIMSRTGVLFNPVRKDAYKNLFNPLLREGFSPKEIIDMILTPLSEMNPGLKNFGVVRVLKYKAGIPSSLKKEKNFNFVELRKQYGLSEK